MITTRPGQVYQILPLGFVLELGLLLVLAIIIPQSVPRVMGWIWPVTDNDRSR